MKNDLIKLAESLEALADAIEKDAESGAAHIKVAERRATLDYGTVGDAYNGNDLDPIARFALDQQ